MPLTQGDLLRNYFFMRLPPGEHERWYTTVWSPMQARLGERFDDYMRDFLLKEGQPVRPDEVYQEWRKRLGPLDEEGIRDVLRELAAWSLEYDQILHPQREADVDVRRRLQRLTAWSKTVPYQFNPLLLRLHADYRRGGLTAEQVTRLFLAIESLLVRRLFTWRTGARRQPVADRAVRRRRGRGGPRGGVCGVARETAARVAQTTRTSPKASFGYPLYFASHPEQRKLVARSARR